MMVDVEKYTKEYLSELDKELEMIPLTFDPIFKGVFEKNLELLKRFLNVTLDLGLDLNECKITLLSNELPKENKKEYQKTVDIYVLLNERIYIDIEINRSNFEKVKLRNYLYDNKLYSMLLEKGDSINQLRSQYFYQLNLNTKDKTIPYGEDIIVSYGLKTKSIYLDHKYVVLKYLEFYRDLYFTKSDFLNEDEIWLASLTATSFVELNEMLSHILTVQDKDKLIGEVIRTSKDYFSIHEWEKEKCDELVRQESERIDRENRQKALEEGFQQGIEQGIEQGTRQGVEEYCEKDVKREFR